jgi:hypothetical protein
MCSGELRVTANRRVILVTTVSFAGAGFLGTNTYENPNFQDTADLAANWEGAPPVSSLPAFLHAWAICRSPGR